MRLRWIGKEGFTFVPGWPSEDHSERDPEVAEAKLASGLYVEQGGPPKADPATETPEAGNGSESA